LGVDAAARRRLLRSGAWWSCARGAVCVLPRGELAGPPALRSRRVHAVEAAAAVVRRQGHEVAGASALILHGLPTLSVPPAVELITPGSVSTGRRGAVHLRVATRPFRPSFWFGVPVLSILDALGDVSRRDRRSGLMAADAALRESLVTTADLDLVARSLVGLRGSRPAAAVLRLASPLSESPLESVVRLALHDDGLPPPELQAEVVGADGRTYRVDFLWPERRVIVEADGRVKYRDAELWREKSREVALQRAGYRVLRVRWRDVLADWPATTASLRDFLHQTP
jgi:hypothetical protein